MRIDLWSDVVCPWCWIGKRRLERALELTGTTSSVEIVYRSFELDPSRTQARPALEVLAEKFGGRPADVQRRLAPLQAQAADLGLTFDFERAILGRTFDAHRLIHGAASQGKGGEMMERLHRAYFTEGKDVSDHATLHALGGEIGLDEGSVTDWLASGAYAADVEADKAQAAAYGIHGVPFAVLANRYAVEGAQPVELFVSALSRARADSELQPATPAGAVCEDELCAPPDRHGA